MFLQLATVGGHLPSSVVAYTKIHRLPGQAEPMVHMQIMERGCALLGYAPIGNIGMLLLATRLRTAAVLPGGHAVRLVTESRWLQLPLQVHTCAASAQRGRNIPRMS